MHDDQPIAQPVPRDQRVWAIDALRGFALFGVLAINLETEFRVSLFEQFFAPSPAALADRIAAAVLAYGFEFKALALFSLLFGVGLAIQHGRLDDHPHRTALLVRRLLVLLGFGLIHLFLIWNGDILTEYALAGLIALPMLALPPRAALWTGIALLAVYAAIPWLPLPFDFPETVWMEQHSAQARHIYGTGSFAEILRFRIEEVPQIAKLLAYVFPRTLGLILLGTWLWRSNALDWLAQRRGALPLAAAVLFCTGTMLTAQQRGLLEWLPVNEVGASIRDVAAPLFTAAAFALAIIWSGGNFRARSWLDWLAPVGRMAFTNYITQSAVLGVLFYGYGFGLIGQLGVAQGLAIAVALFAIQAWLSAAWLRRHRFGPLEWLWRTAMYGKRQKWLTSR